MSSPKMNSRCFCIDASVAVKWFLSEETGQERAGELLQAFAHGNLDIAVPSLFYYEMGNLFSLAVRRQRLDITKALQCLQELTALHLEIIPIEKDPSSIMYFSQKYNLSYSDSAYLATAEYLGQPFLTADERLFRAVSGSLPWVLSLKDFA